MRYFKLKFGYLIEVREGARLRYLYTYQLAERYPMDLREGDVFRVSAAECDDQKFYITNGTRVARTKKPKYHG